MFVQRRIFGLTKNVLLALKSFSSDEGLLGNWKNFQKTEQFFFFIEEFYAVLRNFFVVKNFSSQLIDFFWSWRIFVDTWKFFGSWLIFVVLNDFFGMLNNFLGGRKFLHGARKIFWEDKIFRCWKRFLVLCWTFAVSLKGFLGDERFIGCWRIFGKCWRFFCVAKCFLRAVRFGGGVLKKLFGVFTGLEGWKIYWVL